MTAAAEMPEAGKASGAAAVSESGRENRPEPDAPEGVKPRKKQPARVFKRYAARADTDTSGSCSSRYQAVKNAVRNRTIRPSVNAVASFEYGGKTSGKDTAKRYLAAMREEGVLEPVIVRNRTQYRLAGTV